MSKHKEYTITRRRHPQGYHTMVITPRDAPEEAAEYRLTAGREQAQIAAMRRELDKHLAAGGSPAVERNPSDLYEEEDEVAARAFLCAAGDGKWPVAVVIGGELKGIARLERWQRMSDDSHPRYGFHLLNWHESIPRGSNAEMLWRLRPATQADIDVLAKRYKGLPSGVRIGTDGAPVVAREIA